MLFAITTLLDDTAWQEILDQIPEGRKLVASNKIEAQFPHFSWIVSQGLDIEKISKALKRIAETSQSFDTMSGGAGVFPGENPAVTLILVRNREMCRLHKRIWSACAKHTMELKPTYAPETWIPHITLLHYGVQKREYDRFLEKTIYSEIHFKIRVDNLAIIFRDGEQSGQIARFDMNDGVK